MVLKLLKIVGVSFITIVVLFVGLLAKAALTPSVPLNYTKTVKTGGNIESEYLKMGSYKVSYEEKKVDEYYKKIEVYYPTELKSTNNNYPVVVFANGTGVVGSKYKALFEHLASWGFIVLGNEDEGSADGVSTMETLKYILNENDRKDSIFYQKIDVDNIGISGHSQGGSAVLTSVSEGVYKNYFKTAVALSPTHEEMALQLGWHYDLTKVEVPTLLLAGTSGDFETKLVIPFEKMLEMYDKITAPVVMARKSGCEHGDMLYKADGYVTAWFMWQLKGDDHAAKAFTGDLPELLNNSLYQDQQFDLR